MFFSPAIYTELSISKGLLTVTVFLVDPDRN